MRTTFLFSFLLLAFLGRAQIIELSDSSFIYDSSDSAFFSKNNTILNGLVGIPPGGIKIKTADTLLFLSFGCTQMSSYAKDLIVIDIMPQFVYEYECMCEDSAFCNEAGLLQVSIIPDCNRLKYRIQSLSVKDNMQINNLLQTVLLNGGIDNLSLDEKEFLLVNYFTFLSQLKISCGAKGSGVADSIFEWYSNTSKLQVDIFRLEYYHKISDLYMSHKKEPENLIDFMHWYISKRI